MAIGNGNIGACVNLIKGHKLFIFVINSCLFASVLSQSRFLFLIFLYPDRKSPYHPGPAPPAPLMGPRRYLEENHRARPTPLISCFGGLTALLTTSSLALLIYFLTSHITRSSQPPKPVTDPHLGSALPSLLISGFLALPSSDTVLRTMSLCLEAASPVPFWISNTPFPTGDSTDHNAVRPVVAKYLGEPRAGTPKPFSGILAPCPLCLHLRWRRWPAGVSG